MTQGSVERETETPRNRRVSSDQLLHLLVSDLLEPHDAQPREVIEGALAALVEHLDLTAAGVLALERRPRPCLAWSGKDGFTETAVDTLSPQVPLLDPPLNGRIIERPGPGQSWHVELSTDQQLMLGTLQPHLTATQITLPHGTDGELTLVALRSGLDTPSGTDLDTLRAALSHFVHYVMRVEAERNIGRLSALDEALASLPTSLVDANPNDLVAALRHPAHRIASIMECPAVRVRQLTELSPWWQARLELYEEPTRILYRSSWAMTISNGTNPVGLLTWRSGTLDDADTNDAFRRFLKQVPTVVERLETERRLEAAFQKAPIGICLYDAEDRIIDCNDAFVRFLGHERASEIQGLRRTDLVDDELTLPAPAPDGSCDTRCDLSFRHRRGHLVRGRVTSVQLTDGSSFLLDHIEELSDERPPTVGNDDARRIDALTGLHTRPAVKAVLEDRIAAAQPAAVLVIDLDRFSAINDSIGHVAADELLQGVAHRLTSVARTGTVARLNADEFMVVFPNTNHHNVVSLAESILAAVREPFQVGGDAIRTGASIGICIPQRSTTAEASMLAASEALRQAKFRGRNRYAINHEEMSQHSGRFVSDLRTAVLEHELDVHFQPELQLDTGAVLSAEALVRWTHSEYGPIDASEFVPLAEEIGICSDISDHVLTAACRAAAAWRADFPRQAISVSVNLSQRDVEAPTIVDRVTAALEESSLDPSALCLELTETAVMRDRHTATTHLNQLKDLGVSLAIDDFGTGFSSLWLLRELPFDMLKIDQTFVQALDAGNTADLAIVETIVRLATTMGMGTTAEGIETEAQRRALLDIGVCRGQGFLFAAAAPDDRMRLRLHEQVSTAKPESQGLHHRV